MDYKSFAEAMDYLVAEYPVNLGRYIVRCTGDIRSNNVGMSNVN